ncbi:3'-5' exonuclease [Dyadobacter chenwenxiniae]|uniref:3'-5' exonuclease n=1 Tax=Dyadobacter chenwenxiniae TaxID=2906456 RepID=A0A9X1PQB3_9BACT|nr:3'-5' exonuclease [Dyadobacter chenwenxiniae]MCF0065492.1 3'-5' exonuclease [Dyadobacter chenwenxiniae]UON82100.1 3'-5' exonuclease [Dyadobacter chenwenxiniae]
MTEEFRRRAKNFLLLDIETVSSFASYDELPERMQKLWDKKALTFRKGDDETSNAAYFYDRGAIYSEFGKIVCIAFGAFYWNEKEEISFKVSSFSGDNEADILLQFKALIEKYPADQLILCAHNGKEFDFPFLCRRMLIHCIEIPKALQISGKKPWEILHQDTMDLWKFGDYKNYTSLDLLAAVFDISGSKNEMSGDQVTKVYYEENDLAKICRYCREDVVVLAQLYLRLHCFKVVQPENILRIE